MYIIVVIGEVVVASYHGPCGVRRNGDKDKLLEVDTHEATWCGEMGGYMFFYFVFVLILEPQNS